jgi:2',3'-cyclic-nucleotide 2'-phosphodiesterase (5'-nucleotidase family)
MECLIVEEANASWPSDRAHWTIGEINRVDYGKSGRLFELPVNQGGFGNRALLLKELTAEISKSRGHILKIDMGHRNADFELPNSQRYRVDLKGLDSLGYSILMPYEFEFLLGVDSLSALLKEHPSLTLMATNVTSPKNTGLFTPYKLIEIDSVRIGILAVVDPTLETNLSGKILKEIKFEEYISATQKTVDKLQKLKPDVIIALSNMKNSDNTLLSENIKGIHLISGNFTDHAINWTTSKEITLNQNEKQGVGAPYDISSIRDFGVEIGRIELNFNHHGPKIGYKLKSISQKSYKVSDRLGADDKLMKDITKGALKSLGGKGELLFPAFIDLIEQNTARMR